MAAIQIPTTAAVDNAAATMVTVVSTAQGCSWRTQFPEVKSHWEVVQSVPPEEFVLQIFGTYEQPEKSKHVVLVQLLAWVVGQT